MIKNLTLSTLKLTLTNLVYLLTEGGKKKYGATYENTVYTEIK